MSCSYSVRKTKHPGLCQHHCRAHSADAKKRLRGPCRKHVPLRTGHTGFEDTVLTELPSSFRIETHSGKLYCSCPLTQPKSPSLRLWLYLQQADGIQ